ncbi:MAG: DUF1508 domain-containing protein [Candidatus Borkfalkiaceae bacterium]|nr:DUF1508 domain-containing protein [Christensenellaceae bacterium]
MAELKFPMVSLNNSLFALFGLEIEIWQIAIVGVLIVALIACLVVAAIRSGKKRKIRIRKYIENEEKAISLRKRLRAVNEDISRINFDYASKKNALNAQLKKVNDDYRVEHGREDSEYLAQSDKLLKLNEKLRDVSLRLKKKGLKPNDEKTLRTELADAEAEHDELSEKIAAMREAKSARDAELKSKTEVIEKELALRKENHDADLAEKNGEKAKIEDDLEKLASSQVKIGVKDAEAILEEFRVADDADREIRLNQAREDVERAKNEYLEAVERRAQFERERADAVASAKEDAKRKLALEKAQAETEAEVGYIIAEPAQNVEQPAEEATEINEHVGEETVGLTEETTLEPAADEPAANEAAEEKAEENNETAANEAAEEKAEENNETAATETIGTTSTEEIAATETVEIAEEVTETNEPTEEAAIEPIEEAVEPATTEETEETATDGVKPATNDEKIIRMPKVIYNDGIPATPIHKKSKYAKPITKLLVKKPVVKEEPEQNVQTKEEARKSAYLGKWKVEKTEDGKLFAKLRASNGGILLTTPVYTSEIGLKNGINAIKKSLAADNVTVTANKAGKFVFKITAPSGRTIVTSEQYAAKFQCEKALDSAKRFAETAVISE